MGVVSRIGIRREDKNEWERRVPLTPDNVRLLVRKGYDVVVQPSNIRVFKDTEFEAAGATVQEDLSKCDIVFGIKEFPVPFFFDKGTYMFFSHVIKGQKHNMPMLRKILETRGTLLDYERVIDEKNRRLIFFGNYAGLAGMLETLHTLGKRLEWEGLKTPFLALKRPLEYDTLGEAKAALGVIGKWLSTHGLPEGRVPMVFGFAGYGNVSKGAQEIFDILPHEDIAPERLEAFMKEGKFSRNTLYKVVFYEKDMVVPADPKGKFELQDYFAHPEKYKGVFEQYLPSLTVLVNGIYWDSRYPRLVSKKWVRENFSDGKHPRLTVFGDISCDVEGSIECTVRPTEPGNPVYVYNPVDGTVREGYEGEGPVVMAVEILPTELPRESSIFFGDMLMPYIPGIMSADSRGDFSSCNLPLPIKRSVIVYKGELTPEYAYIQKFL